MAIHLLQHRQIVEAPLERCWAFFSDPRNLARVTPPELGLRVGSELPAAIQSGLLIRYQVRPLLGVPLTWLTEIKQVDPPHCFVDEQRIGPYRLWHHEHRFAALTPDRTEVLDTVHYVLPLGPIGDLLGARFVRAQLDRIFRFREEAVSAWFAPREERAAVVTAS